MLEHRTLGYFLDPAQIHLFGLFVANETGKFPDNVWGKIVEEVALEKTFQVRSEVCLNSLDEC